jgi:hypothetical protein
MNFESYWQENKRFVLNVAGGALAFLILWWVIDSTLGKDLQNLEARRTRLRQDLAAALFGTEELERAQAENAALRESVTRLREHTDFKARERFALRPGDAPSSRYVSVVSEAREELLQEVGRAGLIVPQDLGLPTLAPTREAEIARTLEALDAVDRTVRLAAEAGAERIDQIRIRLDSRLLAGKPIADLEKTLVELQLTGPSQPIVRLLELLAQPRPEGVLLVQSAVIKDARGRRDEVRLELVLAVTHPHGLGAGAAVEGEG